MEWTGALQAVVLHPAPFGRGSETPNT